MNDLEKWRAGVGRFILGLLLGWHKSVLQHAQTHGICGSGLILRMNTQPFSERSCGVTASFDSVNENKQECAVSVICVWQKDTLIMGKSHQASQ